MEGWKDRPPFPAAQNKHTIPVSDDVLANSVHCDACQTIEFAFAAAILSEFFDVNAVGIKHLDAVIRGISDDDAVVWSDSDAPRPCKRSWFAPPSAYLEQLSALLEVLCPRGHTCQSWHTGCRR